MDRETKARRQAAKRPTLSKWYRVTDKRYGNDTMFESWPELLEETYTLAILSAQSTFGDYVKSIATAMLRTAEEYEPETPNTLSKAVP